MQTEQLRNYILKDLRSTGRYGIETLIKYLDGYDYFTAPASTKYHSNEEGGLALHSYNVVKLLLAKREQYKLNVTVNECKIAGYLHDLCKMNMYKKGMKIQKDKATDSKWVGVESYIIDEALPVGHAEKSLILASRYIDLTPNEIMMIRWHMGIPKEYVESLNFNKCADLQPAIIAMMTSDMEASFLIETVTDDAKELPVEEYNKFKRKQQNELKSSQGYDYKIDIKEIDANAFQFGKSPEVY